MRSVFSPEALICPAVRVSVRVDDWLNNKFHVICVLSKFSISGFIYKPLTISGRDPFAGVNTAVDSDNLKNSDFTIFIINPLTTGVENKC